LTQADAEADELITGHAERLGVGLDPETTKPVVSEGIAAAYQQLVA
jgi:hypothetical protein